MIRVTMPCGSRRMKALGANVPACAPAAAPATGTRKPSTKPAAAAAPRKSRRVSSTEISATALTIRRRALDGLADAHVGPAAADVAGHGRVDVGIAGLRRGVEQGRRGHDLARRAVAALHDLEVQPGLLH